MNFTHLTSEEIEELDRLERLNLINSVSGPKSANLIGTVDSEGNTNLAVFSSVIHLGSAPALIGFIMRPPKTPRHTYENIIATGVYTINQIHEGIIEKAHYTGAAFERDVSEFETCGLEEQMLAGLKAPYVKESRLKLGMRLVDDIAIDVNGCRLIIGAIEHIYFEGEVQRNDGTLNLQALEAVAISGLDRYHKMDTGTSFPYPRATDVPAFESSKKRPDSVVYDEKSGGYNAALLPYATSVAGPSFAAGDLTLWKNQSASKISTHFKTRFEEIKQEYQAMVDQYSWNEIVYTAKFRFEPTIGETYHLYERDNGERFLSPIGPHTWKKKCLGSFQLNTDRMWMKIDEETL